MSKESRLDTKEWMDLGYYSTKEYNECLHQLDRIGKYLGGDSATLQAFKSLQSRPTSILDVGCGSGSFAIQLAQQYPEAQILGIDVAPEAIKYANKQLSEKHSHLKNIKFEVVSEPRLKHAPKTFDVVTSTLVCHHLNDYEITNFLKDASAIAKKAIIINDLHRHPIASFAFKMVAPLLFPHPMVIHDGLISIKRSFKRTDWNTYIQSANISMNNVSLSWHWAFRWMLVINTEEENV